MEIHTIGFTKKDAGEFFEALKRARIGRVIDVRLNNTSQLAGFAKRANLAYLLEQVCGAGYVHEPRLAPTKDILDRYKKKRIAWEEYEREFLGLLKERQAENILPKDLFAVPTALLCSESSAEHCHRRLVAEYLREAWGGVTINHL